MNRTIKEGVLNMAQIVNVNFKMDAEDKGEWKALAQEWD